MKSLTLPKSSLLTKSASYRLVYKQGKRMHGDNFSLIYTPNGQQASRLGISIHGQLKGAVRRNRIKRIIREFYRLNRTFLQRQGSGGTEATAGVDIVFTVRQGFSLDSPATIAQAVDLLLAKDTRGRERSGRTN